MNTYPNNIPVFPTLTDEVDVVAANDENSARNEIIALCTYIGTTPQGTMTDMTTRLNRFLSPNGVVVNSNAYPADTTPMRLFYRTDLETLYIRRNDNSNWQSIGGSPSNVLLSWSGGDISSGDCGIGIETGLAGTTPKYIYFITPQGAATYTCIDTQLKKVSGISSVFLYMKIFNSTQSGGTQKVSGVLNINAGAVTGTTGQIASTVPTWVNSATIDISGLTNGTTYNMKIQLSDDDSSNRGAMLSCIVFGA